MENNMTGDSIVAKYEEAYKRLERIMQETRLPNDPIRQDVEGLLSAARMRDKTIAIIESRVLDHVQQVREFMQTSSIPDLDIGLMNFLVLGGLCAFLRIINNTTPNENSITNSALETILSICFRAFVRLSLEDTLSKAVLVTSVAQAGFEKLPIIRDICPNEDASQLCNMNNIPLYLAFAAMLFADLLVIASSAKTAKEVAVKAKEGFLGFMYPNNNRGAAVQDVNPRRRPRRGEHRGMRFAPPPDHVANQLPIGLRPLMTPN